MNPKIASEIQSEQDHGRQKYGRGPNDLAHDDDQPVYMWTGCIRDHVDRAEAATPMDYRQHLIKVAGLAVSAVEAFDRRNGITPACEPERGGSFSGDICKPPRDANRTSCNSVEVDQLRAQLTAATQRAEKAEAALLVRKTDVRKALEIAHDNLVDTCGGAVLAQDDQTVNCIKLALKRLNEEPNCGAPCGQGYVKDGVSKEELRPTIKLLGLLAEEDISMSADKDIADELSRLQKLIGS